jgi:hypothetical protein
VLSFAQQAGIGTPGDRSSGGASGRRRAFMEAAVSGDVGSPEQLRREQEAALLATVERGRGRGLVIDSMGVARRSMGGRRHVPEEDSGVCLGGRRDGEDGPAETTTVEEVEDEGNVWARGRRRRFFPSFYCSRTQTSFLSFLLSQRDAVCFLPSIAAGYCLSLYRLRQAASHGEGEGATPKKSCTKRLSYFHSF